MGLLLNGSQEKSQVKQERFKRASLVQFSFSFMSDQDWANGPASAPVDQTLANGHDEVVWSRQPDQTRRSASPRRTDNMECSRSPLGDRISNANGSQPNHDRGRSIDIANPGNNLHISGISIKADDRDLEDLFSKYGKVIKSQLMRDPHTRDVRGFGFVTMETCEQAELAISSVNGTEFFGKVLSVEKARRCRGRTPTPGHYRGPPKREDHHRPYEPRGSYYHRHDPSDRRHDDRGRREFDDGRYGRRDHDDRRYRYDDRGSDRYGYAAPMRERHEERYDRRRDDREYDRRRY
ncbi:hypothetical protein O181_060694 [Austropuccinia psidii MF-1]|uniref:RRM domain-containing protein n=1 Tax=Austropuccinia psidii MF-1 TaxID=1389203 RepID=A0A9Q3EGR1_9BASI|nr:hypothetical protein [Austropuccinia psidii MF-1]